MKHGQMNKLTVYTGQKHTLYLHAYINTHAHSSTDTYTNHIFEYLPKGINYSTKRGSIFGAVFFSRFLRLSVFCYTRQKLRSIGIVFYLIHTMKFQLNYTEYM